MNLYIIRHATALPLNAPGVESDEARPLSHDGQQEVRALVAAFQQMGVAFDRMYTSPLVRAKQTAEGMQKGLNLPAERVLDSDHLQPGGSGKKLAKLLRKAEGGQIAVVGHEPDLSRLAGWLIGSKRAQLDLAKAGVACLSCDGPPGKGAATLCWLVTPGMLGVTGGKL